MSNSQCVAGYTNDFTLITLILIIVVVSWKLRHQASYPEWPRFIDQEQDIVYGIVTRRLASRIAIKQ